MENKLSKYLKKMRIEKNETLEDMAGKIGVSKAFLSAVEKGKRKMPEKRLEILVKEYKLSEKEKIDLYKAIEISQDKITISAKGLDDEKRMMLINMKKGLGRLKKEDVNKINKLLEHIK